MNLMRPSLLVGILSAVTVIGVVGMAIGGFVFGLAISQPAYSPSVGIIYAFLTTLFLGFPPKDESGSGDRYNAWPYILITDFGLVLILTATITALWVYFRMGKNLRNPESQ